MPARKIHAHFIEPMLLLRTERPPTGPAWVYELKFDGFRAEAVKTGGRSAFARGASALPD